MPTHLYSTPSFPNRSFPLPGEVAAAPTASATARSWAERLLTWRQRLGKGLQSADGVIRLLWLQSNAEAAETAGKYRQANFWWKERDRQLATLPKGHLGWDAARPLLPSPFQLAGDADLRRAMVREIIFDIHLALANGIPDAQRSQFHLDQVLRHLDPDGLDLSEKAELLFECDLRQTEQSMETFPERAFTTVADWKKTYALHPAVSFEANRLYERAIQFLKERRNFVGACRLMADIRADHPTRGNRLRCETLEDTLIAEAVAGKDWLTAEEVAAAAADRDPLLFSRYAELAFQAGASIGIASRSAAILGRLAGHSLCPAAIRKAARAEIDKILDGLGQKDDALEELMVVDPTRLQYQHRFCTAHLQSAQNELEGPYAAQVIEGRIARLQHALTKQPGFFGAMEALAVVHLYAGAVRSRLNEPSLALLHLEKALAYSPDWQAALDARSQVEKYIDEMRQALRQVESQLGTTYSFGSSTTRVLSEDGLKLKEMLRTVTYPRDQFRNSGEPRKLAEAKTLARAKQFWLKAGLPCPDKNWDTLARDFDQATDLLFAEKSSNLSELMYRWESVKDQRKCPWLSQVSPHHLLRAVADDLDAFDENDDPFRPQPATAAELPDDPPAAAPAGRPKPKLLAMAGVHTDREEVPFAYWWHSRWSIPAKAALAAGLLLACGVVFLFSLRSDSSERRDRAYAELQEAAKAHDEGAARQAAANFHAAERSLWPDNRRAVVTSIETAASGWASLKKRDEAYARLVKASAAIDLKGARQAADDFLAALETAADARSDQVAAEPDRLARWVERNRAWAKLQDSGGNLTDAEIMEHAECFLANAQNKDNDARTPKVRTIYVECFNRWLRSEPLPALAEEKGARLRELVFREPQR